MRGSIRQRGKTSWQICINLPAAAEGGKRRRHFELVHGPKRNAQRRLTELLASVDQGSYITPQHLTLADHLQNWLSGYVATNCSIRTQDSYRSTVERHLVPRLGQIPLNRLQPESIQSYYAVALKTLSARSVHYHHRLLSQSLKYAVRQRVIVFNPCELVDPPRAVKAQMRTLTAAELGHLLNVARDSTYFPVIYMASLTGLRQAELLGLRWRDMDLDLLSISVCQTLYKRRGICEFNEPKSPHSRRRISISPRLALFLKGYKAAKQAQFVALGQPVTDDDLVFNTIDGVPMDPGTLSHGFNRITRRAGLQRFRFHDLRHTFASLMLMAGVHPKIVSEALGHASVAFTLDTYSHVIPGLQEAAMRKLDEIVSPGFEDSVAKASPSVFDLATE